MQTFGNMVFGAILAGLTIGPAAWADAGVLAAAPSIHTSPVQIAPALELSTPTVLSAARVHL